MKDWFTWLGTGLLLLLTNKFMALTLGGAAGTHARYWLSRWLDEAGWARGFPLGTFAVNVSGTFVLALAAVILLERLPPAHHAWYVLIGTGFCGAFTTFSTFQWETFRLVRDGDWMLAVMNVGLSVAAGFLGVILAIALVHGAFPRR